MATILLVDDDPSVRALVHRILSLDHHAIVEAEDPYAAVAAARGRAIDLVITDLDMPRLSGNAAVRLLRAEFGASPILVLSGSFPDSGLTTHSVEALGADRALAKPFRVQQLIEIVDELLRLPRPRAAESVQ